MSDHPVDVLREMMKALGVEPDEEHLARLQAICDEPAEMTKGREVTRAELQVEFVRTLLAKLDAGARDYGEVSFHKPLPQTADELLAELVDWAGWAFVAWVNLKIRFHHITLKADELDPPKT